MSGGLAGVKGNAGITGVTVTDLAVPTVQKIMTLRTRKTGVAHIYHKSGKVVASPEWDLARDTAISRTAAEYAEVPRRGTGAYSQIPHKRRFTEFLQHFRVPVGHHYLTHPKVQ